MNTKNKFFFTGTILIVGMVMFVLLGSVFTYTEYQTARGHHLIGASYMTMNNEFYKIINEEISQRVEAEGDQLILRNPALSVKRQINQIQEMLAMGVDVLVLTPVDWESLTDVLKQAKAQGVYIVVVDTNVKDEDLVDCTITSSNYSAGRMVGEYFISQHKSAKVVLMVQSGAKSGSDRTNGFTDVISRYEDIQIVDRIECEGQLELAMPKMLQLIDTGTDFDQVFCLNDLAAIGVVAALDEKNLLEKVGVYGVDASPDSKALIKENMMVATAAQFPSKIGAEAAKSIYDLLDGKQVQESIFIPVELVTNDNVDAYGIDRWQ